MNENEELSNSLIRMHNIVKNFGTVQALKGVDFVIYPKEIVGLIGDNAAGKSTLVKILVGAYYADNGEIYFENQKVFINNPRTARDIGIGIIYQDSGLIENANVSENIFLGDEPSKAILGRFIRIVDRRKMQKESYRVLDKVKSTINSIRTEVQYLSGGQQKTVAIGRAILRQYKLVIMDEPTAGLGVKEVGKLLELVKQLKSQGTSVVYITHRLEDLFAVVDRVVVLRAGTNAGERKIDETTDEELIKLMVGSVKPSANSNNLK